MKNWVNIEGNCLKSLFLVLRNFFETFLHKASTNPAISVQPTIAARLLQHELFHPAITMSYPLWWLALRHNLVIPLPNLHFATTLESQHFKLTSLWKSITRVLPFQIRFERPYELLSVSTTRKNKSSLDVPPHSFTDGPWPQLA